MSVENYKEIIRRWVEEAWNNGNTESAARLYSPDYLLHVNTDPDIVGAQGLVAFVAAYRSGMPDLHFEIEDIFGEGDKLCWRMTATGTQTGELFGVPPTGRRVSIPALVLSRFENDLWTEDWVVNDSLSMLQQVGVIPTPEQNKQPAAV